MGLRFESEIDRAGLDAAAFVQDWIAIGVEEAEHFQAIVQRLNDLGAEYGDLPAHGALWEAAERTADHVLARLAIAPLVLEARGLDVTPGMARRLRKGGDGPSALILDRIFTDEIGHVACGVRWFERICQARGRDPVRVFADLVAERFRGGLKPPFNSKARAEAGLTHEFYGAWNGPCEASAVER